MSSVEIIRAQIRHGTDGMEEASTFIESGSDNSTTIAREVAVARGTIASLMAWFVALEERIEKEVVSNYQKAQSKYNDAQAPIDDSLTGASSDNPHVQSFRTSSRELATKTESALQNTAATANPIADIAKSLHRADQLASNIAHILEVNGTIGDHIIDEGAKAAVAAQLYGESL